MALSRESVRLCFALGTAALLWFYMFSPWTQGAPNFWIVMSCSAVVLTTLGLVFRFRKSFSFSRPLLQIAGGVVLALALWAVFWVGDRLSSLMFGFARAEVDAVYAMKQGLPLPLIAALLLVLIGPAEEFFWRGCIQEALSRILPGRRAADWAFVVTAVLYALIHVWSFNFMLIMAALVAGIVWGLGYRLCPKALPALMISHALWDALVFVVWPI